jgi:hypothetical protein
MQNEYKMRFVDLRRQTGGLFVPGVVNTELQVAVKVNTSSFTSHIHNTTTNYINPAYYFVFGVV